MIVARVPATSANLGSGFDCLGLALELFNEVMLIPDSPFHITLIGEGADTLPRDRSNLVYRTIRRFFDLTGFAAPSFALRLTNAIPLTGGLGSSSAALLGGLLAGNRLANDQLSRDDILRIAFEQEGHPDNVVPALLGGLALAVADGENLKTVSLPLPMGTKGVLFLPKFSTSTREARRLLPQRVPHRDATFNVGRAALFVAAASSGRLDLLRTATQDRLHQPYRAVLFPQMQRFFDAALDAGAFGVWLSGSGSALMALVGDDGKAVAGAFETAARANRVAGRAAIVELCRSGATIEGWAE